MKRILLLLLALHMVCTIMVCAEETVVICDSGDYRIVAEKYPVAAPGRTAYMYKNYGVTDKNGKVIVPQKYEGILPPSEDRAAFVKNGKIGFFDENWNECIEAKYYCNAFPFSGISFSEGLAAVPMKDEARYMLWGYIDKNGNEVIDFIYDSASPFENGKAQVGIQEEVYNYNTKMKYGKIDKDGKLIEPFKFGYALGKDYEYLWKEPIEVELSQNLIEINGRRYKNSEIEYPFINYLGFSYIPLTYYGCRMMGINCDWTKEDGVVLSSGGKAAEDIMGDNDMKEGILEKASFYKGKITINGKLYEYGDTAYPLIQYKNVVYIPVLWQRGMEELGINYEFLGAEKLKNSDRGMMVFKMK